MSDNSVPGNQPEAASERMAVRSTIGERIEAAETVFAENALDQALAKKLSQLPADYDPLYVKNVIVPSLRPKTYIGERPALPMIDVMLSKEMLMSSPIGGLLYQTWQPNQEVEGVTVFIRDLEKRGPDNLRKKIYVSAVTPDLYAPVYSAKAKAFLDSLFDNSNAGQPLMACYNDNFFDFYWNLHLGLKGSDVPKEVRDFGESFIAALAYGDFTLRVVYENYMNARKHRATLNEWINARVKDIASGKAPNSQQNMAWYWIKNGELGENFRERDVVFECMHNFIAFGQLGFAVYAFMEKLEEDQGDAAIRALFKKTMESDYDQAGGAAFTPLDRFVMKLFRT